MSHSPTLQQLLEALPDAAVVTDELGLVHLVNTAFEQLFGLDRGALEGRQLEGLVPSLRPVEGVQRLFARRPDGTTVEVELARGPSLDGRVTSTLRRAQSRSGSDGRDDGRGLEKHHADRLLALGVLSAGVAHELANALTPLVTNLFMVSDQTERLAELVPSQSRGLVEDFTALVREARVAADHSRELARDFRAFSRPEESRVESVDVRDVLESALRMAQTELRHRARVVTSFVSVPPVEARASRLRQVFLNLLLNAAQAITPGAPDANEVKVVLRSDGVQVVVEVHDTGVGIAPEHRARLFEPFFTTRQGEGTGLGLSISAGIVAEARGELLVESAPGKGSTFSVVLPVLATARGPSVEARESARGRVLVIDDEQMVANAIRISLGEGHEVSVSTRPHDALGRLEAGARFDVILCDLVMPEMTGIEFHAAVLRLDAAQARRIVFVTGATNGQARRFLAGLPNAQVDKPFEPGHLRALISTLVAEAQAVQRLGTTQGSRA